MSFNVMVIPEDFPNDRWVLEPIITKMLQQAGVRNARIRVCPQRFSGVSDVLRWEHIQEVIDRYQWGVNLFLLCVDLEGPPNIKKKIEDRERQALENLAPGKALFAENAWQEIEVWALAGHDLPEKWKWVEVRSEVHAKEVYFEPFASQNGLTEAPGGGRKKLAEEAARHYGRIRQRCPEDIAALEARIQKWFEA